MTPIKNQHGLPGNQAFLQFTGIQDVNHEYRHQNPVLKGQNQPGSVLPGTQTPFTSGETGASSTCQVRKPD